MNNPIDSSKIKIKKLSRKEVLDFFGLIKTLRTTLTKKILRERIESIDHLPEHHFWGAFRDEKKVGFCHASLGVNLSPGGKDICLNDLIVAKSSRHAGVGSKLLGKVDELALRKNCKRILVTVRTDNCSALKFYKRRDFERRGWARLVREL